MATDETRQLNPKELKEDEDAVTAVSAITTYAPQKPEFAVVVMAGTEANQHQDGLTAQIAKAKQELLLAEQAAEAKRDAKVALEWQRHKWVIGARTQVEAQFGEDSDEYASTGRKKKSEYKRRSSKKTPPATS